MNWISKGGIYMVRNIKKKTFKMRKKEINLNTVNCKNMYHRFKTCHNKNK